MLVVALQYKCNDYFRLVCNIAGFSYFIYCLIVKIFDYHLIRKVKVRGFQFHLFRVCVLKQGVLHVPHKVHIFKVQPYVLSQHRKFI